MMIIQFCPRRLISLKYHVSYVECEFVPRSLLDVFPTFRHLRRYLAIVICIVFTPNLFSLTFQGTLANGNYSPYSNGHTYTSSRPQSPQVSFLSSTHHLNPHVSGSFIGRDESSNVPASHPRGQGQVKTRHIVKHNIIMIKRQTYCSYEQALLVIASLNFFLAFPFIAL